MNKHHEIALQEAKNWLENVDADEFLNDFVELQDQACGPTVDEFIKNVLESGNGSLAKFYIPVDDDSFKLSGITISRSKGELSELE